MNSTVTRLLLLVSLGTTGLYFYAGKHLHVLPEEGALLRLLQREPVQSLINEDKYTFTYGERTYEIKPVANYEIWGLVVSHNDISSFTDIYHDDASVDFRDICVIWGQNVEDELYDEFTFWSEPWTCNWQTKDAAAHQAFRKRQIANSHLLSEDPEVRSIIRSMRVGDQIRLRGQLINYYPSGYPDHVRQSSTVRTDTGNGACEVMMVDDAEILAATRSGWHLVCSASGIAAVSSFVGFLVLVIGGTLAEQRGREQRIAEALANSRKTKASATTGHPAPVVETTAPAEPDEIMLKNAFATEAKSDDTES